MSNTNTEVLATAYEKLQGAITQSNTVLPKLEEAVEKGNLDNYATVSQLEEKAYKAFVTPEDFNAIGDGITDDKTAVESCLNYAVTNNIKAVLSKKYLIGSLITIDANTKSLNIEVSGKITPSTSGLLIKNVQSGKIKINVYKGGNETLENRAIEFQNCEYLDIDIYSYNYRGLVCKMGDDNSTRVSKSNARIKGDYNMQLLEHGGINNDDITDAFGSYDYIIDWHSDYGVTFQNCADITIKHVENLFWDSTRTKNSFNFNYCRATHIDNFAIGGVAKYLASFTNCSVSINKAFLCNEDTDTSNIQTKGLEITGNNVQMRIGHIKDLLTKEVVDITGLSGMLNIDFIEVKDMAKTSIITKDGSSLGLKNNTGYSTVYKSSNGGIDIQYNDASIINHYSSLNKVKYAAGIKNSVEYGIGVYDDDGNWIGKPLKINDTGAIRLGLPNGILGFYDTLGTTKQTINDSSTDLETVIALTNNIRTILINLGLVNTSS